MTNIYIKSFNRPFYLDRCIRSVKLNVLRYGKIIVLDDGTETRFLEKISQIHPDVEVRSSGADDGKMALLRQERFLEIGNSYPSAVQFWITEIAKDEAEFAVVIEDDSWFCRQIDLASLTAHLSADDANICKLWWTNEKHDIVESLSATRGPVIEKFIPKIDGPLDLYQIWIVAFAMFRRDYWLNNVAAAARLGDESSQLMAAFDYAKRHTSRSFYKSDCRCIFQGWMIPGRSTPEYYELGLRQHIYMDAVNDGWLSGYLNVMQNYPYDFDIDYIAGIMEPKITAENLSVWRQWHRRDIRYFY